LVYESTDLEEGWDGYHGGVLQNNDVYVYKIQVRTWLEEIRSIQGYINLLR